MQIALGAGSWGNQNIESCGVEQTNSGFDLRISNKFIFFPAF